jgi:hypothetical protein
MNVFPMQEVAEVPAVRGAMKKSVPCVRESLHAAF